MRVDVIADGTVLRRVQTQTMLNFRAHLPCTSLRRDILSIGEKNRWYDKRLSLPEKLLSTASWRGPAVMDANFQMADFKRGISHPAW